jgi:hypothetical protein
LTGAAWVAQACIGMALVLPLATQLVALRARAGATATVAATPSPERAAPWAPVRDPERVRVYFPRPASVPPRRAPQVTAADWVARARAQLADLGITSLFTVVAVRHSPSGTHVRLQQTAGGIPVHGAEAVVSFDRALRPLSVVADLQAMAPDVPVAPEAPLAPEAGTANAPDTLRAAAAIGGRAMDGAAAAARALAAVGARHVLAPPAVEIFHRRRDATWGLEQRVRFAALEPAGDWEVWLDAASGSVRDIHDRTVFAAPARVFRPDPALALGLPALGDGGGADAAVPAAAYVDVQLAALAPPAGGWWRLRGPWVEVRDWEPPWIAPDSALGADFRRNRAQPGFEDAMAYYHLDALQRWYQDLGFEDANHRVQVIDTHGLNGQDNSKFVPSLHRIACGDGGVDDAEDAAVLVHEYGHATQYDIVPAWGTGGHTGAMGEGFGDYLANSYAWSLFPERVQAWNGVFQWDGHNEFWAGRRAIDPTLHYPQDAALAVHRAGTLWCSALTDALYRIGDRRVMDTLVLDHHYALTGTATMADAANAILTADVAIYGGAHVAILVETFARWGMVDAAAWQPILFEHAPLDIATADATSAAITARVLATAAPVTCVTAFVRSRGSANVALDLAAQAGDLWTAMLPVPAGLDIDLEYWLEARDAEGRTVTCPAAGGSAPFAVGFGMFADRFEIDRGWQAAASGDGAVTGRWVRAAPVGTSAQPGADHSSGDALCFVTGNGAAGAPASDADVDGGTTTLTSPSWDLRGAQRATLAYWRWYSNDLTTQAPDDAFVVELSNDDGATWVEAERLEQAASDWRRVELDLSARFTPLDRVRVRFIASDTGIGSIVEAAIDDVLLQADFATATSAAAQAPPSLQLSVTSPSRGTTAMHVALAAAGPARLGIYDARGRRVRRLWDEERGPGAHRVEWDGRDAGGRRVARGTYFIRLESAGRVLVRKVVRIAD